MQILEQTLQDIGLSEKEAKIYLACFQYRKIGATSLARITNIPRASVYDIIEKLLKKGYLQSSKQEEVSIFSATPPKDILLLFQRKSDNILHQANILKNHITIFDRMQQGKTTQPTMKYYEGKDAVKMIYQKLQLNYSRSIFNMDIMIKEKTFLDIDDFFHLLSDQTIHAKKIIAYSELAVQFQKKMKNINPNIFIKLLPKEYSIQSDHIMGDDFFRHVSYGEKLTVLEVIDPIFYDTQRKMFDFIREKI